VKTTENDERLEKEGYTSTRNISQNIIPGLRRIGIGIRAFGAIRIFPKFFKENSILEREKRKGYKEILSSKFMANNGSQKID